MVTVDCHFRSIVAVNEWDGSKKLLWLKARVTGKAMKDRFKTESRKGRYQAEFQACHKKASKGWSNFAQDLPILVDKAFPHLHKEAHESHIILHKLITHNGF